MSGALHSKQVCGIAGFAGHADPEWRDARVREMVGALVRRGPDAEGFERWPGAALGHRRLSIFDLSSAGRQPMLGPHRRTGVVFNGAIFNFLDLRRELTEAGYAFSSRTDTEVLVHGYRAWGIEGLTRRLRGMFAFALWDDELQKLYLVRDRLGVKPLAYSIQGSNIAFASTPRALRAAGLAGEISCDALAEYLEFGFVTDCRSIYENVAKLPAASILEFSSGAVRQWKYWDLPEAPDAAAVAFEEAVERTEQLFLDSVRLRLEADVPVGALLSGGIDSSLVCWAIAKLGSGIKAFTVGTAGDPSDETSDARATARELGIQHEVIQLSGQEDPEIETLVEAFAEPFACSSALGMLRVCQAVRREATVLLTGDGGDDVFLGYPEHKNFWLAQRAAHLFPAPLAAIWNTRRCTPRQGAMKRAANFLNYAAGGVGAVAHAHDGIQPFMEERLLGPKLAMCRVKQREIAWSPASGRRLLSDFLRYDRDTRFTGEYLTKVDGASMHHALEARSPFLDQELWNFAATLPFSIRLRAGVLKAVLREIARRRLGARVAHGSKRGFTIPAQRWMLSKWKAHADAAFSESLLARQGYISNTELQRWWKQTVDRQQCSLQIWRLFVLEYWMRAERKAAHVNPLESVAS